MHKASNLGRDRNLEGWVARKEDGKRGRRRGKERLEDKFHFAKLTIVVVLSLLWVESKEKKKKEEPKMTCSMNESSYGRLCLSSIFEIYALNMCWKWIHQYATSLFVLNISPSNLPIAKPGGCCSESKEEELATVHLVCGYDITTLFGCYHQLDLLAFDGTSNSKPMIWRHITKPPPSPSQ